MIIALSAATCLSQTFARSSEKSAEERIEMSAAGWSAYVFRDGSVVVKREIESNTMLVTASTPPNSVKYEKIKKTLLAEFQKPTSSKQTGLVSAGIRMPNQQSLILHSIQDVAIWNGLVENIEPKLGGLTLDTFKRATEKWPLKVNKPSEE